MCSWLSHYLLEVPPLTRCLPLQFPQMWKGSIKLDLGFWHTFCGTLRTQGPLQRARAGLGYIRTSRTCRPLCLLHSDFHFKILPMFVFEKGLILLFLFVPWLLQTCHVLNSIQHFLFFPIKQRYSPSHTLYMLHSRREDSISS